MIAEVPTAIVATERLVLIRYELDGQFYAGSGLRIGGQFVLTADHCAVGSEHRVLFLGEEHAAEIHVRSHTTDIDLAVLLVRTATPIARLKCARVDRKVATKVEQCQTLGFPRWKRSAEGRISAQLDGFIPTGEGLRPTTSGGLGVGLLALKGIGATVAEHPIPMGDLEGSSSPWAGMSGAVVLASNLIVGVVRSHNIAEGGASLTITPLDAVDGLPKDARDAMWAALGVQEPSLLPSLPIAGTANTVPLPFSGAIDNFRRQYLGGPKLAIPFGGRHRELAFLSDWLADPQAVPFLLVVAPAGSGKSALLVRWLETIHIASAFIPISVRYGLSTEPDVLRSVVSRLALAHGRPVPSGDINTMRDLLGDLLTRAAPANVPFVLILDGIDETQGWSIGPGFLPSVPGAGVRVVIGVRLTGRRPSPQAWYDTLGWNLRDAAYLEVGRLDEDGISDVLRSAGDSIARLATSDAVTKQLLDYTAGDALVLSMTIAELHAQLPLDSTQFLLRLRASPSGLSGIFDRWEDDQQRLWTATKATVGPVVRALRDILACAYAPLNRRTLLDVCERLTRIDGDSLDEALAAMDRFLICNEADRSYSFAHPRLAEYHRSRLEEDGRLADRHSAFAAWGLEQLAGLVAGAKAPADAPPYAVRHLGDHIEAAGLPPEQTLALVTPAWQGAWDAATEESNGYKADVNRAARVARESVSRHLDKNEWAPIAADSVRCALVAAGVDDTLIFMSGGLARSLVQCNIWTDRRALNTVKLLGDEVDRIEGIGDIASVLNVDALRDALDAMGTHSSRVGSATFGAALGALVVRATTLHGEESALSILRQRPPSCERAIAILRLLNEHPATHEVGASRLLIEDLVAMGENPSVDDWDQVFDCVADTATPEMVAGSLGPSTESDFRVAIQFIRECAGDTLPEDLMSPRNSAWIGRLAPWLPVEFRHAALEQVITDLEAGVTHDGEDRPLLIQDVFSAPDMRELHILRTLEPVARRFEPGQARRSLVLLRSLSALSSGLFAKETNALQLVLVLRLPRNEWNGEMLPLLDRIDEYLVGAWNDPANVIALGQLGASSAVFASIDADPDIDQSWDKIEAMKQVAMFLSEGDIRRAIAACERLNPYHRRIVLTSLLAALAAVDRDHAKEALRRASATFGNHATRAARALREEAKRLADTRPSEGTAVSVYTVPSGTTQTVVGRGLVGRRSVLSSDPLTFVLALLRPELVGSPSGAYSLDSELLVSNLSGIDADGMHLVRAAIEEVNSAGVRNELRSAVSVRFAQLGERDAALSTAAMIYEKLALRAYGAILSVTPTPALDSWLSVIQRRFGAESYGGEREILTREAAERLRLCDRTTQWLLLEAWLSRNATRAERLIDLQAYAVPLAHVAGRRAIEALAVWLDETYDLV